MDGLVEYPQEDRAGGMVDQGLELTEEAGRDHRAAAAIADRCWVSLRLGDIREGMQHDIPSVRLVVRTIEAV